MDVHHIMDKKKRDYEEAEIAKNEVIKTYNNAE